MASEKGRESEGKREENKKKWELLKGSHLKTLLMSQKELDAVTVIVWGFYSQTPLQNTKKNQKQKLLQGIKWEENQQGGIKVKKSKSSMNSVKGVGNLQNWRAGCENSQFSQVA